MLRPLPDAEWTDARRYVGSLTAAMGDWCSARGLPRRLRFVEMGYEVPWASPSDDRLEVRLQIGNEVEQSDLPFVVRLMTAGSLSSSPVAGAARLRERLGLEPATDYPLPASDVLVLVQLHSMCSTFLNDVTPPGLRNLAKSQSWIDADSLEFIIELDGDIGIGVGSDETPYLHGFYRPAGQTTRRTLRIDRLWLPELWQLFSFMWSQLEVEDPETGGLARSGRLPLAGPQSIVKLP